MTKSECITQLDDLSCHCASMIDKNEPTGVWQKDVEALEMAINILKNM